MNKSVIKILIVAAIAFLVGVFVNPVELFSSKGIHPGQLGTKVPQTEIYTCPMHPHINESHEADCPICGMSLVQKEIDQIQVTENDSGRPAVYVQPSVINNFAIKTDRVVRGGISKNIRIYGYVNKVKKLDKILLKSPVSGSVRFINRSEENNKFYKNEVIIALESNEVLTLQKQYLQANRSNDILSMRQLKQKLSKLGYSFGQLKELVSTQKPSNIYMFRYSDTGLLKQLNIKLKQKIKVGEVIGHFLPLYSISAVSKVYESQWVWLKPGQKVAMRIRSFPEVIWRGEVRSVDDLGQSSTSAVKMVADFEQNPAVKLRLGMQSEMTVFTESKSDVLQVPSSAVIHTGLKNVVVIAKANGYFQPVDVITGLDNDENVEIISGVKEGLKVVVSGQFLLDSESELRAEIARMSSTEPESQH